MTSRRAAEDKFGRAAAAGDAICDSGMLSLPSAEESELAMVASCGGRCVEGTSTAKTVRIESDRW